MNQLIFCAPQGRPSSPDFAREKPHPFRPKSPAEQISQSDLLMCSSPDRCKQREVLQQKKKNLRRPYVVAGPVLAVR
jgi:hypothetical protein